MQNLVFIVLVSLLASGVVLAKPELEQRLLAKYPLIDNKKFEEDCLHLVSSLRLKQIKQCSLLRAEEINAFVLDNGHVYLTSSLLLMLKNTHQWASILAHENAHLELDHYSKRLEKIQNPGFFFTKSRLKKFIRKQEAEADEWASLKLSKKGFDPEQVSFFLLRVNETVQRTSKFHLKLNKRISSDSEKTEWIDKEFIEQVNSYLRDNNQ